MVTPGMFAAIPCRARLAGRTTTPPGDNEGAFLKALSDFGIAVLAPAAIAPPSTFFELL